MSFGGVDPELLRASLLGGAVGDSLGAEIEFWSLDQIRERFPDGLTELPPHDGIRGAITDDTQMSFLPRKASSMPTSAGSSAVSGTRRVRSTWHFCAGSKPKGTVRI